jgi:hypothetical protein
MYLHGSRVEVKGGFMKGAINVRVILGLCLLAFGGARALAATEGVADGQEQARQLLSGEHASVYSSKAGFVSPSSIAAKPIALDAQDQAREMLLGRQIAKRPIVEADGSRVAGARRDGKAAVNPQEMARLMILGRQSAVVEAKIRLTSKPE